jgi:hypothetical protein
MIKNMIKDSVNSVLDSMPDLEEKIQSQFEISDDMIYALATT